MSKYRHAKKPSALKIVLIILCVLVSIAIIVGAVFLISGLTSDKKDKNEPAPTVEQTQPPATVPPTQAPTEDPQLKYTTMAQEYMGTMTDDEKIYQMLMVTPESLTGVDVATMAGDATSNAITEYPVGGIYYTAQNFEDSEQTTELIETTKSFAKHPMFIAVSEEGGENAPVASTIGSTDIDVMSAYSEDGELVAFENADAIAKDIKAFGFNLNFAPTAVLNGDNAYSTDPAVAGTLVNQAVKGYQSNDVVSVLSSFPDVADSDTSYEDMKTNEFVPFVSAFNGGADAIMIGNCTASAIDADNPAFMSSRVVTDILIKDLQFGGLIMSPMLNDESITGTYSADDIVTKSINAGVNMFVCPDDIDTYYTAIKSALDNNLITQQQIDESVTKILTLKFKYGILDENSFSTSATGGADAPTTVVTTPPTEYATITEE